MRLVFESSYTKTVLWHIGFVINNVTQRTKKGYFVLFM